MGFLAQVDTVVSSAEVETLAMEVSLGASFSHAPFGFDLEIHCEGGDGFSDDDPLMIWETFLLP